MRPLNSCKYSFTDLAKAASVDNEIFDFNKPRSEINNIVKYLCLKAGWAYEDVKTPDGVIYTAFSPEKA